MAKHAKHFSAPAIAPLPEETHAVVPLSQFVALQQEAGELRELVDEFLGDGLSEDDLLLIKIPSGGGRSWDLPNEKSERTFAGVILGVQNTRVLWQDGGIGSGAPPLCRSGNGITGVGNPGGTCADCEQKEWGTGRNGVGTACSPRKTIYVLLPNDVLPVRLSLSVTSFTNLRKYQIGLLNRRIRPSDVATTFGLTVATSKGGISYSQATFAMAGQLDPETALRAKAYASLLAAAMGSKGDAAEPEGNQTTTGRELPEEDLPETWEK